MYCIYFPQSTLYGSWFFLQQIFFTTQFTYVWFIESQMIILVRFWVTQSCLHAILLCPKVVWALSEKQTLIASFESSLSGTAHRLTPRYHCQCWVVYDIFENCLSFSFDNNAVLFFSDLQLFAQIHSYIVLNLRTVHNSMEVALVIQENADTISALIHGWCWVIADWPLKETVSWEFCFNWDCGGLV